MKTAIIIGATGLIGKELINTLLDDSYFSRLIVLSRRSTQLKNAKLEEHLIDFDAPNTWAHLVKGDILFSTLGTTIRQAGSKEAQYRIDFTYQYQTAKIAAEQGISSYVLVSSVGANPKAFTFYSKIKGRLEEAVKKLHFKRTHLLRPSLLVGQRQQERIGEKIAFILLRFLNRIGLFKKYPPISGQRVAQAMIRFSKSSQEGIHIHEAATL